MDLLANLMTKEHLSALQAAMIFAPRELVVLRRGVLRVQVVLIVSSLRSQKVTVLIHGFYLKQFIG